jgi:wyosine [tRNA(Phe)-imidazoG37] synthetase (radical SAM superfamily)
MAQFHTSSERRTTKTRPALLLATESGEIFQHPHLELAMDNGLDYVRPVASELTAVPPGWDIMAMPHTRPVGYDSETGEFVTLHEFTYEDDAGISHTVVPCAVAIHPPPGYVRRYHPAAEYLDARHPDEKFKETGGGRLKLFDADRAEIKADEARPGLPLWAYSAVGFGKKGMVAAIFLADEVSRWKPDIYYRSDLDERIEKRLAQDPDNQILKQLSVCARDYLCCCAQNIFYERWEGALPSSPACTAACLGCISKDPEWDTPVPQKRLKFSPEAEDLKKVMVHHLETAPEPMVSFGQGCEGEPTMYGDALVESIRQTRAETPKGVININCNGSRPEVVRDAARAGAEALRISINTFDPDVFEAYYRPSDYNMETVLDSLRAGRDEGMYLSINLLIWPGWTDRMQELDRISALVDEGLIHMIQLRNLCVDPGYFRSILPPREARGILVGMRAFVEELHRRHPKLRFGTFNPRLAADWYDAVPAWVGASGKKRASVS